MLRDIVAKRNIRSIIVQLADTNAAAVFAHIDTLQVAVVGLLAVALN